jgi:uncharacterized membrane protein
VVPRDSAVELPLTVDQAMRMLVSGGVIDPHSANGDNAAAAEAPIPATAQSAPATRTSPVA